MNVAQPCEATRFESLRTAQEIIRDEAAALERLARQLPTTFHDAVELILECKGGVIVTGVGKAGWIGQKISASFASTGTISHFLNPSEAWHGDLGRIGPTDIVLALSNSGETDELVQLLPRINQFQVPIIAVTSKPQSTLARHAQLVLDYGTVRETGHLQLAPSTSTAVMLALGDALALVVSQQRQFQAADFARYHPGGSLGRKLALVEEIMRPLSECRIAVQTETVRETYVRHGGRDRRVGVMLVVDEAGQLTGLFTDSDLARLLERQQDNLLDQPIEQVMTRQPITVRSDTRVSVAIQTLASRNLSELPVVNSQGKPVGLIDITDVVNLLPSV